MENLAVENLYTEEYKKWINSELKKKVLEFKYTDKKGIEHMIEGTLENKNIPKNLTSSNLNIYEHKTKKWYSIAWNSVSSIFIPMKVKNGTN